MSASHVADVDRSQETTGGESNEIEEDGMVGDIPDTHFFELFLAGEEDEGEVSGDENNDDAKDIEEDTAMLGIKIGVVEGAVQYESKSQVLGEQHCTDDVQTILESRI